MPILAQISNSSLINSPNPNLLPQFAMFNNPFSWNIVSGSGTASNESGQQLEGLRCFKVGTVSNPIINSGGSQMSFSVAQDGQYIFSLRHKSQCATLNDQVVNIVIYINGSPTNYTLEAISTDPFAYRTYYQILQLVEDDVIDISFSFNMPSYGGTFKHYFDALKFEFDSLGFGYPTVFSSPLVEDLETTQTIDIPNIVTKTTHRVDITLVGAEVGDFVQITYPITILTDGLIVSVPIVTATNTVSFLIYNNSLSDVDSLSGDYSIKITK